MKKFSIVVISLLTIFSARAQFSNRSAVTITVYGSKYAQLTIDGNAQVLNNNMAMGDKTTISINTLESGQHTLEITGSGQNNFRQEKISTVFMLRRRYDMMINVNANGSLELIEKMKFRNNNGYKPAMSNADFTALLNNVKYQRTTSGKRSVITNAFNSPENYFSCSQVVQLIQQVYGESYRLELAKLSYRTVTDRDNFSQVYNLLSSQASRDELDAFVNNDYGDGNGNGNPNTAMPDADFNNLYQTINQQWPVSAQMNSLSNAFNNNNNYFTSYQASRLIQIVLAENNRLQLAKLSYRSITDPANFSQVSNLLSTQSARNDLAAYIANYSGGGIGYNAAMPDADFNNLYQTINQQWPVSTQMSSLTNAFNNSNNYFTSYQASRLIQIVLAENNRLQLAKLSYRSITDPSNFSQVSNLLSSQSARNDLAAYVANYSGGGGVGYKVAMSDADFNTLYQNIQVQFLPGAKMTAITNTFSNTNYYFNCNQAKQLIEMVTLESNRLQLAKLSYRQITDRANFTQVYDLLYSQASKDELTTYVNTYRD